MKKKIFVSHPTGNANLRSLLKGLISHNMLAEFHTSIASFPGNLWQRVSVLPGLRDFKRRGYDPGLQPYTRQHPFGELGRMLASRLNLSKLIAHETGIFSVDRLYHKLDQTCAKRLEILKPAAVYAYEDGAGFSFEQARELGVVCLYDLPIGYWRAMRRLLEPQKERYPEWAATMTGFLDSDSKVMRKDREIALANHIFVASSFTKKTLEDYPGSLPPVHVVPYGFPEVKGCKHYRTISGSKLKILFVGGLSQRKGIAQLFEACFAFRESIDLQIIGRKAVADCDVLNQSLEQVEYIPSLNHEAVKQQMREADVFVFPSLFEGYGLVIAEAMAQGTPVITTSRTCGADYIEHGKNGWLVEAANTDALMQVFKQLVDTPEMLESVGREAYKTAVANPSTSYGSRMAALISELVT